ncbi:putative small heat shock protein HSP20 [Rosa chinensis]|uniref:Putative small heat shock protein HSP20 n=1 Tax=Rosa chinensis TaxID=74649 RepID=A0A2P6QJD6_ROSCH|nr:putative small heat shock protein HSP20 [Rosa chinensis]
MSLIPSFRRSSVFDPFSLNLWDPFKDFQFPASSLSTFPEFPRENSAFVNTRIDWKETPEAHVEVEDDRVLQISVERKIEKEDKNDTWHRIERSRGKFSRRFSLTENTKIDEIKAAMENGVLSVTIPKVEVNKPDVKAIEISG